MSWDFVERRKFARTKIPCKITIFEPRNFVLRCHTENISAGGIRVIIKEKLRISSIINVDIYADNEKPILCQGRVVWAFARTSHPHKEGPLFDTGIEFYAIKEEDIDTIEKLVDLMACRN